MLRKSILWHPAVLTKSLTTDKLSQQQQIYCSSHAFRTSCRREAAKICSRPGLQVVIRYTSHTHMDPSQSRYPCWLASTANQSGPATLTFDHLTLKVMSESRVSVPILVFLGLSVLDLGPMYATDRQTDVRRASPLNAPWAGA